MALPRIWLLTGAKHGDNAQAQRLADAMGFPFERRRIVLKPGYDRTKQRIEASLHHVDLTASDALTPPWPDLILTIGRHLAMVALWIRSQASGHTKLALIGPPRAGTESFDLIIVPFQFRSEPGPNICRIGLPLLGIDPKRLAVDAERWKGRLAHLPRPLTVFLCGGPIKGYTLDPESAKGVVTTISRMEERGSIQVTTSRRTPVEVADAIAEALPSGAGLYRWDAASEDNPYLGLLAHGDRFVVTGDSISMLVEVARLGKPLAIVPLRPVHDEAAALLQRIGFPEWAIFTVAAAIQQAKERILALAGQKSKQGYTSLHKLMYDNGWAVPFGQPFVIPAHPPADDTATAVARLRQLIGVI
jgi:uncharacterized protein